MASILSSLSSLVGGRDDKQCQVSSFATTYALSVSSLVEGQDCSHRCNDGAEEASAQTARIVAPVLRCRVLVHISMSTRTVQRQAMRTPQRTLSHSLQKNAAFAFSCFTAVSKSLQFMRSS
jgi:hypothetical protein